MRKIIKQNKLGVMIIGIAISLLILVSIGFTNTPVTYAILGTGLVLGTILYVNIMYRLIKKIKSIMKEKAESI